MYVDGGQAGGRCRLVSKSFPRFLSHGEAVPGIGWAKGDVRETGRPRVGRPRRDSGARGVIGRDPRSVRQLHVQLDSGKLLRRFAELLQERHPARVFPDIGEQRLDNDFG